MKQKAEYNITGTQAVIEVGNRIAKRLCAEKSTDRIKTDHKGNVLCDRDKKIVIYPGEGRDNQGRHFFDAVVTIGSEDTILQSFQFDSIEAFEERICEIVLPYIGHKVKTVKYRRRFKEYGMTVSYEDARGHWVEFDGFRVTGFWKNIWNIRTDRTEEITEYRL